MKRANISLRLLLGFALLHTAFLTPASLASARECVDDANSAFYAGTCKSVIELGARSSTSEAGSAIPASSSNAYQDRYLRREVCSDWFVMIEGTTPTVRTWEGEIPECVEAHTPTNLECPGDAGYVLPLWVSPALDDGGYGPWEQISGYECGEDPLPAAIANAWQAMDITPTSYTTQPSTGWAIASMGVIPVMSAEPQTSAVTVLGTPVLLRATPTSFTWTTSDGTEITSTEASQGHSSGATPITFERREYRAQLTLTTTWTGHYSLNGGTTWVEAPGTATTSSDTTSIHVYNPRVHLVDCDTRHACTTGASPSKTALTLTDPDADGIANHLIPDHAIDAYLDARAKGNLWNSKERKNITE